MLLNACEFVKDKQDGFPFSLPFFDNVSIDFATPITFIVGENGTGKSTLVELISKKLNLYQISGLTPLQVRLGLVLKDALLSVKPTYMIKPKGLFFSAEMFTLYVQELDKNKHEAREALDGVEQEYKHKSAYAKMMASTPYKRTLYELDSMYENELEHRSHGETYLDFFKSRIRPNQLIVLDEPETPLSFQNQLALMVLMKEAIAQGCQLIVATHSPVLTSYPGAKIYQLKEKSILETSYESLESVQLMKDFLNRKEVFLNALFNEPKKT